MGHAGMTSLRPGRSLFLFLAQWRSAQSQVIMAMMVCMLCVKAEATTTLFPFAMVSLERSVKGPAARCAAAAVRRDLRSPRLLAALLLLGAALPLLQLDDVT